MLAQRATIGRGRFDPVEFGAKRLEIAKRMETYAKRLGIY
jgi:hypothetical protein